MTTSKKVEDTKFIFCIILYAVVFTEEQVIPGDKSEMEAFVSLAMSNTKILVDVSLPLVSILLESKHMYELIYNRISNDLLLWQPQAPKPNNSNLIKQFESVALDQNYILADNGLRNGTLII